MINDPMSQMAQAQKLSIPQLQQALRDGTINPQVGQIVLASKIKQDKDAKAAMAAQAPKQPPVAQQNMAYGQGVDALPSNLPTQGMAQGGIIAFEEGGEVPRYAVGGKTFIGELTPAQFDNLIPSLQQDYVNQFGAPPARSRAANPIGVTPPSAAVQSALLGSPMRPQLAAAPAAPQAQPVAAQPIPAAAPATTTAPAAAPGNAKSIDDYFGGRESGSVSVKGSQGIGGFNPKGYDIKKYDDSELKDILASEKNPKTGQPWTYDEIAERDKAQAKAAGVDFDVYKSQREELDKLKEKSASRSKLDEAMPWFAAAEAFGRQPRPGEAPQSAIGSMASALGAYGKSATELDKEEQARQDKIRSEGNALALAQNAFNQAQYSGNKADLKDAQAAEKAARMNLANLKVKGVDQQNEVAKEVYKGNVELQKAAMQEAGATARYGKDEQTIKGIAKAIMADHPEMSVSEALKQAYLTKGAASVYGADVGAGKNDRNAYNNWLKLPQNVIKFMNPNTPPPSYEDWAKMQNGNGATVSQNYAGFVDRTKY